jgi:hypothetical protein
MKDQVLYSFYVLFCLEASLCPSSLCVQLRSFEGYPGSFLWEAHTHLHQVNFILIHKSTL